jgi:thiosulfate reductase cytochrome b subunit
MSNATERKVIRWIHLLLSVPIVGYIYGPVAEKPEAAFAVRAFFVPIVVLSGLWMWKGHLVKKWFRKQHMRATDFR